MFGIFVNTEIIYAEVTCITVEYWCNAVFAFRSAYTYLIEVIAQLN